MEPVKPEQTAGPVQDPVVPKDAEVVLLEPAKEDASPKDEAKPVEENPVVLELSKSDGAKDEEVAADEEKDAVKDEKAAPSTTEPATDAKAPEPAAAAKPAPPPPVVEEDDSDDELDDLDGAQTPPGSNSPSNPHRYARRIRRSPI